LVRCDAEDTGGHVEGAERRLTWYAQRKESVVAHRPVQPACAEKHWSKLGSKFPDHAPVCGFSDCTTAPSPPPPPAPSPAPPMPGPFPPSNSTDCTFVPDIQYNHHRVTKGPKMSAKTQEACCARCYKNDRCAAGVWHSDSSPTQKGTCYLHCSAESEREQQGAISYATSRRPWTYWLRDGRRFPPAPATARYALFSSKTHTHTHTQNLDGD
jgi:hypothetical protein